MDAVCTEIFALSPHESCIFCRALNHKLLSQTAKSGMVVAKGLIYPLFLFQQTICSCAHVYKINDTFVLSLHFCAAIVITFCTIRMWTRSATTPSTVSTPTRPTTPSVTAHSQSLVFSVRFLETIQFFQKLNRSQWKTIT